MGKSKPKSQGDSYANTEAGIFRPVRLEVLPSGKARVLDLLTGEKIKGPYDPADFRVMLDTRAKGKFTEEK